ncbi:HlyD family type I secretion periplasmic adaptor subunit [Pseudomonas aeruginosa]|uniref:HlyD family type I secretion periplasmic adaptor subunit n=1 Tax=Pseudomonas aeruginosa TaxID=287 RepID=UPI00032E6119|nr:HlyD family type I secretion periplasmic adaptor subunit [Pseudomonas aeruginosa]EOQ80802.1 HlyD family secretion protein [Pseudomonas aeruginosa VRFPA02]ALY42162.1 hemolysin secretion protein D [Pseudomonas aeruginosa]AXN26640.1 HlyD family type I secretion periplasmic adaptor subunit [Pseudomonas aeruginosa]AZM81360.1 HlyD family type I secretion periplasmic adaptor subunit [Pseudomonas aeruginosa]EIU3493090.1 HlyD family type I secretion periplasmic adaptor subunit [Pseudomonas aeruginos
MGAQRELLQRYRRAWSHSWHNRAKLDTPLRSQHEVHFLPAALALQEQPVHPAPRYIQWAIMLFAALALAWACIGKIEVVATASGKVVPSGRSKVIQPSDVAVVKAIHVRDGQLVKAGELLVELDSNITGADVDRLKSDLLAAHIDSARAAALLDAIRQHTAPTSLAPLLPQASAEQQAAAQRWLEGQYLELRSSLEQIDAEIEERAAEIQAAQAWVGKLQESLPITRQLSADYRRLLEKAYVSKHAYLEKEQSRLDQERELAVQQAKVLELKASKKEAERRQQSVLAQTRRSMLDLQQTAEQKVAALNQELKKAEQRDRLTRLTAPVDGTVQQLAIHTNGGVVTEAQPLMVIVPSDQPVEVEAMLENKDIGFVRPGQAVEIKVETFTFTKYGIIHGTVLSVSDDAIEDERRGLLYSARIQLEENSLRVGDRNLPLTPGMAVRAEVKTDQRKVIDYFLSPLQQYVDESLEER